MDKILKLAEQFETECKSLEKKAGYPADMGTEQEPDMSAIMENIKDLYMMVASVWDSMQRLKASIKNADHDTEVSKTAEK